MKKISVRRQSVRGSGALARRIVRLTGVVVLGFPSLLSHAALVWHWEESFSEAEQQKLEYWIDSTYSAVQRYAGSFPFDVHIHLHRRENAGEPVPWANTRRGERQALFFYVDTRYPLQDFLDDWTAAHEFSHLLIPYLGRENMWFAEGFASYLQHSVMVEMGMLEPAEAFERRDQKMRAAQSTLSPMPDPLPDSVSALRKRGAYPTIYWGGAVYFERVDIALQNSGSSLQKVLQAFLRCCRMHRRTLEELTAALDEAGKTGIFTAELENMRQTQGVPRRPQSLAAPDA